MKITKNYHIPVLLKLAVEYLNVKPGGMYVDATLGGGGHSTEILKKGGKLLSLDYDQDAIDNAKDSLIKNFPKQLITVKSNFNQITEVACENNFNSVDGILFDLGLSSHQLESPDRGFSFNQDGLLDMRMDQNLTVGARELINGLNEGELNELFIKLGEEKFSRRIAGAICSARRIRPIESTVELAQIIEKVVPRRGNYKKIHPATQVFQALRIAVNDELNNLRIALPKSVELLNKGGRLVIISFHSLEDKIVKDYFRVQQLKGVLRIITEKPISPSLEEINTNPRSRSAKLRVAEKV